MTEIKVKDYDGHVYFSLETRNYAEQLREKLIENNFMIKISDLHDEPVGPHLYPMFKIVFPPDLYGKIVPFLAFNRNRLSVLVHPNSGNLLSDHTDYAIWMGEKLDLNIEMFKRK